MYFLDYVIFLEGGGFLEALGMSLFKETGLPYTRIQFKNHWDATRRDWQAWVALRRSTGMGWNVEKNTYSQTKEWWAEFAKQYPGGDKFAEHLLVHVEELDMLFGGSVATGKVVFVPSSGIILQESSEKKSQSEGTSRTSRTRERSEQQEENVTSPVVEEVQDTFGQQNAQGGDTSTVGKQDAQVGNTSIVGKQNSEFGDTSTVGKQNESIRSTLGKKIGPSSSKKGIHSKTTNSERLEDSLNKVCHALVERNKKLKQDANPMLMVMSLLDEVKEIGRASDKWLFTASMLCDPTN